MFHEQLRDLQVRINPSLIPSPRSQRIHFSNRWCVSIQWILHVGVLKIVLRKKSAFRNCQTKFICANANLESFPRGWTATELIGRTALSADADHGPNC